MAECLIEARNLTKTFPAGSGKKLQAVSDVSLSIYEGESLGLVGESGCGKSTLGRLLIRLIRPDCGQLFIRGQEVGNMGDREFAAFRKHLQLIFQDPYASLDPRMNVRNLIAEPLITYKMCRTKDEITERVLALMDVVGVPGEFLYRYPHQFSGGQRQRIGIARAIAGEPSLIVCDEPVSALDVSVQNQILNLLRSIQKERNLSYLFISHDLSVIRHISDRVCVMFLGKILETGPTEEVFAAPLHPYTRFLLDAVPQPDPHRRGEEVRLLKGELPSPVDPPSGCRFRTRCPYAEEICAREEPVMRNVGGREVACHKV
ncbi:MAG: ATP-binding cassette domain-containing protein [Lachnospiraceae bacterium]|nr:ATP-binding cassette domain-containing protein [Lachnospiraceae bacterium]